MTGYALWDLIVVGGMLGMALRWLLRLDVQLHWAACAGAAVFVLQPWVTASVGSLVSPKLLPSIFFGGGVAAAVVAAVQSISSH